MNKQKEIEYWINSDFELKRLLEEVKKKLKFTSTEEKYRWHDLIENPNDLPKENGLYLVILLPPNKEYLFRKTVLIIDLMVICKEKHWHNRRVASDVYENYDERVIAWECIEEFENE